MKVKPVLGKLIIELKNFVDVRNQWNSINGDF